MAVCSIHLLLALFSVTIVHIESSKSNGFSTDLIHRDSPKSPFYDPSKTHFRRVRDALHRSIHRVQHFTRTNNSVFPNTAVADILSTTGEYVMSISVATPTFHILAIADTGSDLIWTQCTPCTNCVGLKSPPFEPEKSSSYQQVPCGTPTCTSTTGVNGCKVTGDPCNYSAQYGDKSYSNGVVAVETLTLQSTSAPDFTIPNIVFGCGFDNGGFLNGVGSGIIGLGGGEVSLISQMGSTINGKFSYCLVPIFGTETNPSKINFGSNGVVSGEGVTTPLLFKNPRTYYYLALEAISVRNERVEFYKSSDTNPMEAGNIIIDSGTTLTFLPRDFYTRLKTVVVDQVKAVEIADPGKVFDLCYDSVMNLVVPDMTVHFHGADLKLNMFNTFIKISDRVLCFAFAPTDALAIYGNLAQMNFLVGYDIQEGTVSFKPVDCTKN